MVVEFQKYRSLELREVFKRHYWLETIQIAGLTFYISKHFFKKRNLTNLPFSFCDSFGFEDSQREQVCFDFLCKYSIKTGKNVIVKSLAEYLWRNKIHCANNPILSLQGGYKEIYNRFSHNLRANVKRNLNKMDREGVRIEQSSSLDDLQKFYCEILTEQYVKKHKMLFQPYPFIRELFEKGVLAFFVAKKGDDVLGGILLIEDGEVLHYNWSAVTDYQNISLGTLLIHETIQYALKRDFQYYDMGSTPLSDDLLFQFKMRWGAINYPVWYYYTLHKPTILDLQGDYQFFRFLYSKFPKCLLIKLMPKIIPWLVC